MIVSPLNQDAGPIKTVSGGRIMSDIMNRKLRLKEGDYHVEGLRELCQRWSPYSLMVNHALTSSASR